MKKKKTLLNIAKITLSCVVFVFFFFNSIDIKVASNHVFGQPTTNLYEGINGSTWNSKIESLSSSSVFVSDNLNGKNSYYSVDVNTNLFNNMIKKPSRIYAGYYFGELQSVQYIYENDSIVFNQLLDNMNYEAQKKNNVGKETKQKDNKGNSYKTVSWCDLQPDVYITLYRVEKEDSSKTIFAVANKKMVDEEINLSNDTAIPTAICYRN